MCVKIICLISLLYIFDRYEQDSTTALLNNAVKTLKKIALLLSLRRKRHVAATINCLKKKPKYIRRWCIHPINSQRYRYGCFKILFQSYEIVHPLLLWGALVMKPFFKHNVHILKHFFLKLSLNINKTTFIKRFKKCFAGWVRTATNMSISSYQ